MRKSVLRNLDAKCTARLLAASAVPSYVFVEFVAFTSLALWTLVLFVRDSSSPGDWVSAGLVVLLGACLTSRRAIRLYLERVRIADAYFDSEDPIASPELGIVAQMEGGKREEFGWAAVMGVGTTGAALAIAMAVGGMQDTALVPGVIAVFALVLVFGWLRSKPKHRNL